jgi:hypothetical protein
MGRNIKDFSRMGSTTDREDGKLPMEGRFIVEILKMEILMEL